MKDGEAKREPLSSVVWIKLLYGQAFHIHLQLIICNVLHPGTQAFIEESSGALLKTEYRRVIYCVLLKWCNMVCIIRYCTYIRVTHVLHHIFTEALLIFNGNESHSAHEGVHIQ